ncbi:hypothetical protein K1719_043698 [Acacia pycnantha]|nr:hypothetical protein K1719_043698 [Acacia pycnantha]
MAMGRRKKKDEASKEPNPEAAERQRLKRLAFSNGILSETPAKAPRRLNPSDAVLKHLGKDIGTKNPVLYVDFPQGQMKLFGTKLYPKNGYLTLQFSKDGKNAQCEDYFDNMTHGGLGGKMKTLKKLDLISPRNCTRANKLTMSL